MKSSNAATRHTQLDQTGDVSAPQVDSAIARNIASHWMDIVACETHLEIMGRGVLPYRAVPAAQNIIASICSDLITPETTVTCVNTQSYGWMSAAGQSVTDIMRTYIGKIFADRVLSMSAEDCANTIKKGPMNIVALHVDSPADWNDVRVISAGAVKANAPMLLVISAAVPAPEGVAIDRVSELNEAAVKIREACEQVRDQGAIRVIAMDDVDVASMENTMMQAAGVNPSDWQDAIQKNNDGAERAANAAYQSPVESF